MYSRFTGAIMIVLAIATADGSSQSPGRKDTPEGRFDVRVALPGSIGEYGLLLEVDSEGNLYGISGRRADLAQIGQTIMKSNRDMTINMYFKDQGKTSLGTLSKILKALERNVPVKVTVKVLVHIG